MHDNGSDDDESPMASGDMTPAADDAYIQRRREINRRAANKARKNLKERSLCAQKMFYDAQCAHTRLTYVKKQLALRKRALEIEIFQHQTIGACKYAAAEDNGTNSSQFHPHPYSDYDADDVFLMQADLGRQISCGTMSVLPGLIDVPRRIQSQQTLLAAEKPDSSQHQSPLSRSFNEPRPRTTTSLSIASPCVTDPFGLPLPTSQVGLDHCRLTSDDTNFSDCQLASILTGSLSLEEPTSPATYYDDLQDWDAWSSDSEDYQTSITAEQDAGEQTCNVNASVVASEFHDLDLLDQFYSAQCRSQNMNDDALVQEGLHLGEENQLMLRTVGGGQAVVASVHPPASMIRPGSNAPQSGEMSRAHLQYDWHNSHYQSDSTEQSSGQSTAATTDRPSQESPGTDDIPCHVWDFTDEN